MTQGLTAACEHSSQDPTSADSAVPKDHTPRALPTRLCRWKETQGVMRLLDGRREKSDHGAKLEAF